MGDSLRVWYVFMRANGKSGGKIQGSKRTVGKKGEIYWTIFLFYFLILKNGNHFAEIFCHICNFGPQHIFWSIKKLPPDKEVHHQFWAYFFLCGENLLK